jgi:hypothetical protein
VCAVAAQIFPPETVSKMTLPELRVQLRARGCSPAGGKQTLVERLNEAIALDVAGREHHMQHQARQAPPPNQQQYYERQVRCPSPPCVPPSLAGGVRPLSREGRTERGLARRQKRREHKLFRLGVDGPIVVGGGVGAACRWQAGHRLRT